ncbi:unnamed protein product [Meganyctiphanes norvegica]|uniref:Uncharacterized protein n=1 Tax=Meganyctiphanes norvegica TaxID=48144 RepID=A0AAV2QEL6_MEGNR
MLFAVRQKGILHCGAYIAPRAVALLSHPIYWWVQVKRSQIAWLNLTGGREILIKSSRNASHSRESRQNSRQPGQMVTTNHARPKDVQNALAIRLGSDFTRR